METHTHITQAAKNYLAKGFSIIPLKERDKKPIGPWKKYQSRKPTDEELVTWFGNGSKPNLGIVAGKISGIVVLDMDSEEAFQLAKEKGLPQTPMVKTGRGYHAYFRHKDRVGNFQKRDDLPGIDLRGDGGYAVAPPSIHVSGIQYTWMEGVSLDDLPLAELPEWVLAKKAKDKTPIKKLYKGVEKGNRNDSLARLTGSWVNDGLSMKDCLENAILWNTKNDPPLSEQEIKSTVESIFEKHQQDKDTKNLTQAQKLIILASPLPLFHDQHKEAFVFLAGEAIPLKSKKIRQWLSHRLYQTEETAPNSDSVSKTVTVLEGKAIFDNPQITLYNRISLHDNAFWYDLGREKAVRVTSAGWSIVDAPILFRRYSHQQSQVTPVKGGDPWRLFEFLNVSSEHKLLVLVYVISCFIPDIPHPIFHPHGIQGAGKTTLCKIIKLLCDPSNIGTLLTPRDPAQLIQVIAHHHVCLFDNLSDLPSWMSDILAQACTGGGFSKRQLYTDDDDVIYQVKRCIGLNGINLQISKPDLMDRAILLPLERIMPHQRMEESKLWERFEQARPEILGGFFDVLVKAMGIYPTVKIKSLFRMADFTRWGYAITQALGKNGDEFLSAYKNNIVRQNEEIIQNNTLAQTVLTFMAERESWEGTISKAWQALRDMAGPDKTDNTFPKNDRMLRNYLDRIKANLNDYGIYYSIAKKGEKGVPITFQRVGKFGSFDSAGSDSLKNKEFLAEPKLTQNARN